MLMYIAIDAEKSHIALGKRRRLIIHVHFLTRCHGERRLLDSSSSFF